MDGPRLAFEEAASMSTIAEHRRRHAAYELHRRRQVAYGRWEPWADAGPVREHLRALMDAGVSRRKIAALAEVPETAVVRVLYGAGKPPAAKIRTATAKQLLAVQATPEVLAGARFIDATGTQRRLQALVANGWWKNRLAAELGLDANCVWRYLTQATITPVKAAAVKEMYERLWDQAPPVRDRWEQSASTAARRMAAANGWARPMDWDEDIDDPAARPCRPGGDSAVDEVAVERALGGEAVDLAPADVAEAVRVGTARGMSAAQLARATKRSSRTVQRRRSAA